MVTFTKIYRTATEKWFVVGDCFSNDEKPVFDICQGSVLKEHDTGKKYKFDEENKLWAEVSADDPISLDDNTGDNPEPETQWNYAIPEVVAQGHGSYAEYTAPEGALLYTKMPLGWDRSPAEAFVYTELSMEDDHVIANYTFEGWYATGSDNYFPYEGSMIMPEELNTWTKVDPDNYDGTFGNVLVARYSRGG